MNDNAFMLAERGERPAATDYYFNASARVAASVEYHELTNGGKMRFPVLKKIEVT